MTTDEGMIAIYAMNTKVNELTLSNSLIIHEDN